MKKLFSIASILLLAVTLSGCTTEGTTDEVSNLQSELDQKIEAISALEEQVLDLQEQLEVANQMVMESDAKKDDLQAEVTYLEVLLSELEKDILDLQDQIFDNVITFTFTGYDTYHSTTVGYNDDFDGSLFDLLKDNVDVNYSESDFGVFITGIEGIETMAGNYIAITKNEEMSMVGIADMTFADEDVIGFELTWWDSGLEDVYNAIHLFVDNHAEAYVNDLSVDYNVALGLYNLGVLEDYTTSSQVEALIDTSALSTNMDYFKALMLLQTVGSDTDAIITDLISDASLGGYGNTAYGLLALNSYDHGQDFATFQTNALNSYASESPYDLGLDAGGVSVLALSHYAGDTTIDSYITDYTNWIAADQLSSGGIKTRDMVYGETTYPGTENAASIAQVILALLSLDQDPRTDYVVDGNSLVSRLLEFQTDTGSFDWDLNDEIDEDLMFSTPQAFLALVMYQVYANGSGPVNPYQF
jgi:outer membrane murein-binding lipoprotein Lpp